jgi:hypothetical protein
MGVLTCGGRLLVRFFALYTTTHCGGSRAGCWDLGTGDKKPVEKKALSLSCFIRATS